jgi:hypothetical protein
VELGPNEKCCAKLEGWKRETGDHGNACSTRTHVLLSTR